MILFVYLAILDWDVPLPPMLSMVERGAHWFGDFESNPRNEKETD